MFEIIFLICLGIVWIIFAVVQDMKTHEVANWVNFSLVIFALGFRFFWSLFGLGNFSFFYQGLIGFGIFFVLGNLLYYGKVFAGGDAKLMIALGTVLPIYNNFKDNMKLFFVFIFLFLLTGAVYGLISSFVLAFRNKEQFNKEFKKQFSKRKKLIYFSSIFGILSLVFGFYLDVFFLLGIFIFVFPYFYLFAKSVDESCMIKKISPKKLREGDWLYKNIKVGKKLLKAKWDGLSRDEIKIIKKAGKKVLIRFGIPFTPVFLISFLILVFLILFKEFSWVFSYFLG